VAPEEPARWALRFENFLKAERNLDDAVNVSRQRPLSVLEQAGLIQLFEIAWELGWKVLRDFLIWRGVNGSDVATPVAAIRHAYAMGVIGDGQGWMDATKLRHTLSHEYQPDRATAALEQIAGRHLASFRALAESLADEVQRPRFP
jgi:nucleotidyltransferase substrate binding protein (TIGR01987 family)